MAQMTESGNAGETVWESRQQKVMAARAAFGRSSGDGFDRGRQSSGCRTSGGYGNARQAGAWDTGRTVTWQSAGAAQEEMTEKAPVFHFGLMRFLASGMLLLLLIAAFSTGFSYRGFDEAYVRACLDRDAAWTQIEESVRTFYQDSIARASLWHYEKP